MKFLVTQLFILFLLPTGSSLVAQNGAGKTPASAINRPEQTAKLVDEFGILNSEDRSARFDAFFQEISQTPGSVGYVLLFCGKKCRYGEIEAHFRGIELKRALRNFDRSKLSVVHGGYRDEFRTELWLVPAGASAPLPRATVSIRFVTFDERRKYLMEAYDCCDDFSDVWKNIKP